MRTFFKSVIAGVIAWAALSGAATAQLDIGAGEKLTGVAQAIVDRAVARSVRSIAILPFTLPDGGCTSLSSYLADEMMVRLFALDALPVEVVDRQNLAAIVTEAGLGDILDPTTGRELGRISGVDALVVGSLTLSADVVQVTVRLISIDAKVLGASATAIPRTSTIDELLSQPVEGGMFCGGAAGPGTPVATQAAAQGTAPAAEMSAEQGLGGLKVALQSISVAAGGNAASARLVLRNETADAISVMGIYPRLSVSDHDGNVIVFDVAVGLYNCDYSNVFNSSSNSYDHCHPNYWRHATVLPAGATHVVTLRGTRDEDEEGTLAGTLMDLSGTLMVRGAETSVVSLNFPAVAVQ